MTAFSFHKAQIVSESKVCSCECTLSTFSFGFGILWIEPKSSRPELAELPTKVQRYTWKTLQHLLLLPNTPFKVGDSEATFCLTTLVNDMFCNWWRTHLWRESSAEISRQNPRSTDKYASIKLPEEVIMCPLFLQTYYYISFDLTLSAN